MEQPIIFQSPPSIPSGLSDVMRYEFQMTRYKQRIKTTTWIFIELIGTLLILGIIWINVDWIKAFVTVMAILIALILLIALSYVI